VSANIERTIWGRTRMKKIGFVATFLVGLALIVGFLSLKKAGFEEAFNFDSWDEDPNETF